MVVMSLLALPCLSAWQRPWLIRREMIRGVSRLQEQTSLASVRSMILELAGEQTNNIHVALEQQITETFDRCRNPSQGMFPLSVQPSCPGDLLDNCKFGSKYERGVYYKKGSPTAKPGYFSISLDSGVDVETTVTEHTALWNFNFVPNATIGQNISPIFLLDLDDLQNSRQNATVSVDPTTGRISGNGTFLPSFGVGSYMSYFCADFKGASIRDTGVYVNARAGMEPKELFVNRGYSLFFIEAGGFVRFHKPSSGLIQARVGVSFLSTEQACQNAETEIGDWDFDRVRTNAENAWKEKMSVVSIEPGGANKSIQQTFFSGIYRTMMSPQNYTLDNPIVNGSQLYFDSYYCTWDSFRTDFPFLTIFDPSTMSQLITSYLNIYKALGWLPDCRMQLCKGYSQGGSNADNVIADAYVKNLTGIDWDLAYEAIQNDAENEPFDWGVEGRGGLQSWKRLGYIPYEDYDYLGFGPDYHSISRTLEYAYNDFCISTLAKGLGKMADYEQYLQASGNWYNLFKPNQTSYLFGNDTGFTGFLQPRYLNGTWRYQNPIVCSPIDEFCSYSENPMATFEDSIWEYTFFVPQDQAKLVAALGGPDTFVRRLDYLHEHGLLDIGNEPSELVVFQYHYAGRPGLSSRRLHTYIPSYFNSTVEGLPGNDDSGASGSFVALAMSGTFPVAGQSVYLLVPPFFESVSYTNAITNKTSTIRNINFDPEYVNIYIQNATLNGEPYTKNWISHDFYLQGWTLEFTLGPTESEWGTQMADLPPSTSAGQQEAYHMAGAML
ncbi:alpha-1,2-mannosidase [Neohortaea acidophila]|uniref:Alpha-1,2-mannosidase n=1 Tax=Neohortaea acidophila TaxID=245834 RepID=A0A6A6PX58_9PEZI|nr:alpha-1,2-mannosidase [Neohortaea acidophila]KAF2484605.1 alpha-1,2-mannosidase [Neohortaea acidophila]